MFPVSSGFYKAIRNKAPQDIRLEFRNDDYTAGEVITREDIAVTAGGLTLTQILNSTTDIEFGRAVMSELKVMLLNVDGRFTDFNFNREFTARFGVRVAANKYYVVRTNPGLLGLEDAQGNLRVYYAVDGKVLARIYAEEYKEYYLRGGEPFGAATIILWGTKLYIANSQGQLEGAFEIAADGETPEILPTPTEFPLGITEDDVLAWIEEGVCVEVDEDEESLDGWEYIPLGVFRGKRPESVRGKLIEFTAHDNMQMFDIPAADFIAGLEFPCTLKQIFEKLCDFCGAYYVSANDFVNSGKTFAKNPFKDTDHTCREILAYIAEAAGAYAKMAPGGYVRFVYFTHYPGAPTFRRTDRFEMTESEFETPPVDRLEVYNSYSDQLCTSGTGDIVYGISDNPLLYAENSDQVAEMQPYVDAIYNRISLIHAYRPSSFRAEAHPAVECGDVIQVVNDYGETREFPVFAQTITWAGFGKATYENTGGVIRQNAPFTQRELEQLKKKSVKTKDLWTYIDSYLDSDKGVASINAAVGGKFVTEDQISGFITETELNAGVEAYINGEEGIARLTDSLSGVFVTTGEYNKSVRITASSQVFVKAAGASSYTPSSITLTAETKGKGLTFQWYLNNSPISGATGTTLTITSDSFSGSSAAYKIVATDSSGNTFTDIISIAKLADGTNGKNGVTYYTWIKYADSPTSGISDDPSGKKYIGIAPNKTTPTESSNYSDYTWSLIKGADGAPGSNGVDGYTILLSNEFIEVPVNASRFPISAASYTCTVSVYKGLTALSDFTVEVSSLPTGVSATVSGTTVTLKVTTGSAIADTGNVLLKITAGSMTLYKAIVVRANTNALAITGYQKTVVLDADIEKIIDRKTGLAKLRLSASENTTTEISELDVGEPDDDFLVGDGETDVYSFTTRDMEGYYTSLNGGIINSCSYMVLRFNFSAQTEVTFRCICLGETNYDYGLISNVDCDLTVSYKPDDNGGILSSDVFYSFRGQHSVNPVDVVMTIPAGSHYVTIKYVKDSSTNASGDYFKFRAFASIVESTTAKSTITLTQNDIEIASADIKFTGFVTFESLSTPGATTIDGANVKTDNLHVQKVYMGGSTSREILYSTLMSNGAGQIHFGFMETLASMSYAHDIRFYAKKIYFIPPGGDENSDETLLFNLESRRIDGNSSWKLNNVS